MSGALVPLSTTMSDPAISLSRFPAKHYKPSFFGRPTIWSTYRNITFFTPGKPKKHPLFSFLPLNQASVAHSSGCRFFLQFPPYTFPPEKRTFLTTHTRFARRYHGLVFFSCDLFLKAFPLERQLPTARLSRIFFFSVDPVLQHRSLHPEHRHSLAFSAFSRASTSIFTVI